MNVCLIYDFLTEYGGIERLILNHARMLKEQGFEVTILTCHIDPELVKKMGLSEVKIRNISKIRTPFESISLATCYLGLNNLKNIDCDIFISYSFPSNFLIRNKKTKKVNYINHFPHFLYFNQKDKKEWASSTQGVKRKISIFLSLFFGNLLKKLDKKLVLDMDLCFVGCNFTKKSLDKLYNRDLILSYPVLDPVFKPSKTRIDKKFIFSSSRIIPSKKYEWLINICSEMKQKLPLYISGQYSSDYKTKLERLANQKGVEVVFLGKLSTEDLIKYYTSAQAFAFPTPKFEFGLVPAESLACGTPIVVWGDGGGQSEQVNEGVNGFLAKPYDFKNFAEQLEKIINSNFKNKNKNKIINSSKKFSYDYIKESFVSKINSLIS